MRQHERRLVLHIEFAGEGEHALALHLVTERGDGKQIGPQRQLVPSEQGARGDGEITPARLAAPPWMGRRSPARVADRAAAAWTDWSAVGVGPAQAPEHVFDPAVGHAHDLGGTERARRSRKQEMLRHDHHGREDKSAPLLPASAKKYNPESIGGVSYIRRLLPQPSVICSAASSAVTSANIRGSRTASSCVPGAVAKGAVSRRSRPRCRPCWIAAWLRCGPRISGHAPSSPRPGSPHYGSSCWIAAPWTRSASRICAPSSGWMG